MKNQAVSSTLAVAMVAPIIEAFLEAEPEWSATALGKKALNNPKKIFLIREGQDTRPGTARKILATIDEAHPGFSERWVADFMKGEKSNGKK